MYPPPEVLVFLISMLPLLELDAGIPLGAILHLPLEANLFWAILGNMIPVFFLLKFLDPVAKFLMKHSEFFKKFLSKIFEKTHTKHSKYMETIGEIFLIIFIAIPFPGTGAWTGSLLAYLFKIPYWRALLVIFLGVVAGGIIMTLGVTGVMHLPSFLKKF